MNKAQIYQMRKSYDSICNVASWGLNSPQAAPEILGRYIELIAALRSVVPNREAT